MTGVKRMLNSYDFDWIENWNWKLKISKLCIQLTKFQKINKNKNKNKNKRIPKFKTVDTLFVIDKN